MSSRRRIGLESKMLGEFKSNRPVSLGDIILVYGALRLSLLSATVTIAWVMPTWMECLHWHVLGSNISRNHTNFFQTNASPSPNRQLRDNFTYHGTIIIDRGQWVDAKSKYEWRLGVTYIGKNLKFKCSCYFKDTVECTEDNRDARFFSSRWYQGIKMSSIFGWLS